MQTYVPKYTASARQRPWWQRAKPQFWLMLIVVTALALALVWTVGKAVFGTHYVPLNVPPVPTSMAASGQRIPPTETATPTETSLPDGWAPWASQMVLLDNGKYDLPDDARAKLEADWADTVQHFFILPSAFWTSDLVATYTYAGKLRATPTGAPTATPVPEGSTIEMSAPGQRSVQLIGCDQTGATCDITDTWTDLTVYKYDFHSHKIVGSRPGHSTLLYTVTLKWKDGRWKIYTSITKYVQYVTATPNGS